MMRTFTSANTSYKSVSMFAKKDTVSRKPIVEDKPVELSSTYDAEDVENKLELFDLKAMLAK